MGNLKQICMDGYCSNAEYIAGTNIDITDNTVSAPNVYSKNEVNALIGDVSRIRMEVVTQLPQEGENGVIYLVGPDQQDKYEQWVYVDGSWIDLGSSSIDMSDLVTGVKGEQESTYRKGDVNLTPDDIAFLGQNPLSGTSEDTFLHWKGLGTGYAFLSAKLTNGQPYTYGFLISYARGNDIHQEFFGQRNGNHYRRGANQNDTSMPEWEAVFDDSYIKSVGFTKDNVTVNSNSLLVIEIPYTVDSGWSNKGLLHGTIYSATSGGTGVSFCVPYSFWYESDNKARVSVRNNGSSAAKIRAHVEFLFVKNT